MLTLELSRLVTDALIKACGERGVAMKAWFSKKKVKKYFLKIKARALDVASPCQVKAPT